MWNIRALQASVLQERAIVPHGFPQDFDNRCKMTRGAHVYIISSGDMTKIGVAFDPRSRTASLQTGSPAPLVLCHHRQFRDYATARRVEAWMHRQFAELRQSGEWFQLRPEKAWEFLSRVTPPRIKGRADVAAAWPDDDASYTVANLLTS
jgi:hypothetical protein